MVKTKSSVRKSAHVVHQESRQADAEAARHCRSLQRSPPSPDRLAPAPPAEAPAEKPPEAPADVQAKGDGCGQAKPLWRPIPPLLPEPDRGAAGPDTRDQSCQTEDWTAAGQCCVEPGDPPVLQQPLHTSKSGIHQIIECFRSGTSQLRQMLLREVDTIFECKLCRSLFRGLPNLITHKEYYCLSRLPEYDGDDRQNAALQDLTDIIYHRAERSEHVVRLEPIQTTSKAVYQYLTSEEDLARYPSRATSARESPVAWEAETGEAPHKQTCAPESPAGKKRDAEEEAAKEEAPQPEDEGSTSGVEDVTISCCICGQDFNSRRSIRRHCRKMHKTKLEELRKFTETRTVPTSLLSMVKGRPPSLSTPPGKSCPVCLKVFATKTNVRRHFDEVHRGLRRDAITPAIASRPGQPLSLEAAAAPAAATAATATAAAPSRKGNGASPTPKSAAVNARAPPPSQDGAKPPSQAPTSPQAAAPPPNRCTLCKRNYSSQLMLKRHMRIVHKIYSVKSNRSATTSASTTPSAPATTGGGGVQVKEEALEASEDERDEDTDQSPPTFPAHGTGSTKSAPVAAAGAKVKEEETAWSPKTTTAAATQAARSKLSVGFDFKQLFCKLCKRQFSSRQNLSKHIELHMDGNDIFIKFYRCPLCRYESRRKRDVLRHVTVVHKKSSPYLAKIMPKLESRAVKRLAEAVLNSANPKRPGGGGGEKGEVNGRHTATAASPCPSPPVTRKQDGAASSAPPAARKMQEPPPPPPPAPSPPVTRKQERQQAHQPRPVSPPMTRRSDKHSHQHTRRHDTPSECAAFGSSSTEVRVTKNFSLHACDQCGRAFAKKLYLESHKRSHRNAATAAASRRKGVSTRSKSLVW
ncbi:zinc finger protein 800b isoform X2 [Vanacampus margaritifer]